MYTDDESVANGMISILEDKVKKLNLTGKKKAVFRLSMIYDIEPRDPMLAIVAGTKDVDEALLTIEEWTSGRFRSIKPNNAVNIVPEEWFNRPTALNEKTDASWLIEFKDIKYKIKKVTKETPSEKQIYCFKLLETGTPALTRPLINKDKPLPLTKNKAEYKLIKVFMENEGEIDIGDIAAMAKIKDRTAYNTIQSLRSKISNNFPGIGKNDFIENTKGIEGYKRGQKIIFV